MSTGPKDLDKFPVTFPDVRSFFRPCASPTSPLSPLGECARLSTRMKVVQKHKQEDSCNANECGVVNFVKQLSLTLFNSALEKAKGFPEDERSFPPLTSDWEFVFRSVDPETYALVCSNAEAQEQRKDEGFQGDFVPLDAALLVMNQIDISKIESGNSNHVFHLSHPSIHNGNILLRVYGNCSGAIDRDREILAMKSMGATGLSPQILSIFKWGRIEEYVSDALTCTTELLTNSPTLLKVVYGLLKKMHGLSYKELLPQSLNNYVPADHNIPSDISPWKYFEVYKEFMSKLLDESEDLHDYYKLGKEVKIMEDSCPTCLERACLRFLRMLEGVTLDEHKEMFQNFFLDEILWLHHQLKNLQLPIVFSHNDLNPGNILIREENDSQGAQVQKLFFLDFEYSDCNYRAYDLGNGFCELDYSYEPDSQMGFVKPLFHNAGVGDGKPMEYPRLPTSIYECWKQNTAAAQDSIQWKCLEAIRNYFYGDGEGKIDESHLREVFLGMLSSHMLYVLWSFVMATTSSSAGSSEAQPFSVGSAGLDYIAYGQCRLHEYLQLKKWMFEVHLIA